MKLVPIATVILVALFAAIAWTTGARASDVELVRHTEPASCNGQRCVQLRTITYYQHGQDTLIVTKRRTAPAESRTPTSIHPWTSWRVVGAVMVPHTS